MDVSPPCLHVTNGQEEHRHLDTALSNFNAEL